MSKPSTAPLPARLSPRPIRTVSRRLTRSRFAADLMTHGWLAGLLLAGAVAVLTRGEFIAWDGVHTIPAGSTR